MKNVKSHEPFSQLVVPAVTWEGDALVFEGDALVLPLLHDDPILSMSFSYSFPLFPPPPPFLSLLLLFLLSITPPPPAPRPSCSSPTLPQDVGHAGEKAGLLVLVVMPVIKSDNLIYAHVKDIPRASREFNEIPGEAQSEASASLIEKFCFCSVFTHWAL